MTFLKKAKGMSRTDEIKPILKWAGGKRQLLPQLLPLVTMAEGRYIEPFIGGGAVFFALAKPGCVISDCNPELINMYREVADSCEKVIAHLKHYSNDKDCYYHVRSQKWHDLSPTEAAARTIYLNRTCFNGLYRVNKSGDFNVPFGGYKKPNFCDEENLRKASKLLSQTEISCCDFEKLLLEVAQPGDCVFLDPPYFPVSDYADFKRYTKEQFSEEDQIRVATTASVVASRGCHVLATNANHPKVLSLYDDFSIRVVPTKRNISSKASTRTGEDVIIRSKSLFHENALSESVALYPATRYMGSKSKILDELWSILSQFDFDSALDLFSGSGIVGYMFKSQGKRVICNDYMKMSYMFAKALVENPGVTLTADKVLPLLVRSDHCSTFVQDTFAGLYYSDEDNAFIDTVRSNIPALNDEYEQAIAMASLIRACMKKRPRGIFTYVGDRYDDGRADLRKTLEQQFLDAVESFNDAVMLGGPECKALNINSMDVGAMLILFTSILRITRVILITSMFDVIILLKGLLGPGRVLRCRKIPKRRNSSPIQRLFLHMRDL